MAYEFHLPDIGEGLTEAEVVRWLVDVGGEVGMDQPVVEMETDKAVTEIPAPRAGILLYQGAAPGETLEVDALLMVIGDRGERWDPAEATPAAGVPSSSHHGPGDASAPIVGTLEDASDLQRLQALPQVRRLAADLGVDLTTVTGSGAGGRITREDVEAAAGGSGPVERVRMSPTRRSIARNLTRSWQEIPHVTTFGEAEAAPALAARAELGAGGAPVPLEALIVHAVVPVLAEFGAFNATVDGDDLILRRHYDVGVAIDTPDGLMVAVVRGADRLRAAEIGAEITRMAAAARDRTISAGDLRGATFTVSNIGAVGGGYGTPVIPLGTTAILSVGRADPRPVVAGDRLAVGRRFPLSLSYDHRVIDGALGRRFLAAVIEALEGISA